MLTLTPQRDVVIEKSKTLPDALVQYVERVVWGSVEGTRYRILERRSMLQNGLRWGFFLVLRRAEALRGTLFCLPKQVRLSDGRPVRALYESVLSIHPAEGGKGHAKRLIKRAFSEMESEGFQYAYVEEKNRPSWRSFEKLGFEGIGQFSVMTLNRLFPKRSARASKASPSDMEMLKNALPALYQGHALLDLEMSLDEGHYWVLKDLDGIVAGVQIEEERWSIVSLPGASGELIVKVLKKIPGLRLLLDLNSIPVLKLGHLYIPAGREKEFMELVSHLTASYRKKLALVFLDKRSPIYQRLKAKLWFGLFNPIFETPVKVWARFFDMNDKDIQALKEAPLVVSPLDIS